MPKKEAKAPGKRKKIYELRTYIGYGSAGQSKLDSIKRLVKALKLNESQFVLDALKAKYPSLDL